jgi:hypothetical protein
MSVDTFSIFRVFNILEFYLRTETDSGVRNVVFELRQWIMSRKFVTVLIHLHDKGRAMA